TNHPPPRSTLFPYTTLFRSEVQVINDPKTVNAFCMAGGKMAIYSGMWEKMKATDDEVAQVMGHEIGHALANHTQERMSIAYSARSEEHTSELQSLAYLVCRL